MSVPAAERAPLLGQPNKNVARPQDLESRHDEENGGQITSSSEQAAPAKFSSQKAAIITVLLLGVFVANVDGTLVIAQTGAISSEFGSLGGSDWLLTAYFLASCGAQPLIGKLSDIYGRKQMLLWSYTFFTIGNFVCGISPQMWQVLVGRAIAGIGGAGMTSLVSILIADLVSIRNVAAWRSYVNVAATTGRSIGGPMGGALADTVGWRWSFYWQCPVTLVAIILILWRLPGSQSGETQTMEGNRDKWKRKFEKLRRIDFVGAVTIIITTLSFLLALELGGKSMSWTSPITITLFVTALVFANFFYFFEKTSAKEPIFPVHLMGHRDVLTTYPVAIFQSIAQVELMYGVPLYFQIVNGASTLDAGTRLVPAVVGNAAGGLLCGFVIRKTGRYKLLTLFGLAFACLGYALVAFTWHKNAGWVETLYIFPGGFGTGVAQSTTFIALTAGVAPSDLAVAGTGLYQAHGIGASMGSCVTMAILQATLRPLLGRALHRVSAGDEVIKRSIEDISYVRSVRGPLRNLVVRCYVKSLMYTHLASLTFSSLAFLVSLFWKEHKL